MANTTRPPFSGDELAGNKDWVLKTDAATRKKKGRRMFRLRSPTKKHFPPVYITDQEWFFFTVNRTMTLRWKLPATYRQFLRILVEYTMYVKATSQLKAQAAGWDGAAQTPVRLLL